MPSTAKLTELKNILISHRAILLSQDIPWYIRAVQVIGFMQDETVLAINVLLAHIDPDKHNTRCINQHEYHLLKQGTLGAKLAEWESTARNTLDRLDIPQNSPQHQITQSLERHQFSAFRPDRIRQAIPQATNYALLSLSGPSSAMRFRMFDPHLHPTRQPALNIPRPEDSFYSPYYIHHDGIEENRHFDTKNNPLHDVLLPKKEEEWTNLTQGHSSEHSLAEPAAALNQARIDDLEKLLENIQSPDDCYSLFKQQAWSNSPIMLSIKLGRWDMCERLLAKAQTLLSAEQISTIMHQRDSKGMMSLSYALSLRAPKSIILFLLEHTDKQAYYTDNAWATQPDLQGGKKQYDFSALTIREDGYYLDDKKMFSLYPLSPIALYTQPLPDKIKISNRQRSRILADHQSINISEQLEDDKIKQTPFRHILRNLIFHMRTLCISERIPYERGDLSIEINSGKRAHFDIDVNYPRVAKHRNHPDRVDREVCDMIERWMATPLQAPVASITSVDNMA